MGRIGLGMNSGFEKRQFLFRKAVNKDALYQYIGISLNFSHFIYDEFGYIDIGKGKNIKVWIEDEAFSFPVQTVSAETSSPVP